MKKLLLVCFYAFILNSLLAQYKGGIGGGDVFSSTTSHLNINQVWKGPEAAGNNLISTSGNWALGYTPKIGNVIVDNDAVRNIQLVNDEEYDTLFFQNNEVVKVELGDHNLKIKGFVSANNRHLFKTNGTGKVLMEIANNQERVFPIGNTEYNPVTIKNKTGQDDEFMVRVLDNVFLNGLSGDTITTPHVKVTWDIDREDNTRGGDIDFIFQWNQAQEIGSIIEYNLNHHNGINWEFSAGESQSVEGTTIKTMAHTNYNGSFSPFAISENDFPLPVTLIGMQAHCIENKSVLISWQTASEVNSNYFEIQKSNDTQNWRAIGEVQAGGFSNETIRYEFLDNEGLIASHNYYRLKQVDFDGTYSLLPIVVIQCKSEQKNGLVLYPNPNSGKFQIQINNNALEHIAVIEIYSLQGKIIYQEQVSLTAGSNIHLLDLSKASKGIYFLRVLSNYIDLPSAKLAIDK